MSLGAEHPITKQSLFWSNFCVKHIALVFTHSTNIWTLYQLFNDMFLLTINTTPSISCASVQESIVGWIT